MSIELTFFITLLLISYLSIYNLRFFPIFILFYLSFLIIVRVAGFDLDIQTFINTIKKDVWNMYIYKEFAFWLTGRLIYNISKSELLVYLFFDSLWFFIFFATLKVQNLKVVNYRLFILILISFPFILGIENLYRQHIALVLLLSSYLLRHTNSKVSILLAIMAIFFHNSAILYYPLLVFKKTLSFKFLGRFLISNLLLIIILYVILLAKTGELSTLNKSSASTGADFRFVYLSIYIISIYFFIIKFKFKVIKLINLFPSLYFAPIIMIFMMQFPGTAPVERLGMGFLLFFTIDFFQYIERRKISKNNKKILYLLYAIIFSLPTIFFNSIRVFLTTI